MSFFDQCKKCSVIVNGGSGVLFQPMTEEYSYILTAKHNLYDEDNPMETTAICFTRYQEGESDNIIEKYEHTTLDIAILKIEKIDFESPYKQIEYISNGDEFKFYGYPENRRQQAKKIKYFNLKVGDITEQEIVAENDSYYEQSDVSGCSGGGVFRQDGENFILVGIECRMDAESTEEVNNSRLRFISISAFDEIIENNSNELQILHPPYMNNFNLLVDKIFLLNDFEDKRDLVRNKLKYLVRQVSSIVKPLDIKEEFKDELFVNGHNNISNDELWSMYLEFILLIIVLDDEKDITIDKIKEVYKKRKILFAKTNRWIELKEDILKSNLHRLEKNGVIFIACDGDRRPHKCELSTKTILNISNPPQVEEMRIDRGVDYSKDFKYKHIYSVEKNILDNESYFDSATNLDITDKIKEVISNVFE